MKRKVFIIVSFLCCMFCAFAEDVKNEVFFKRLEQLGFADIYVKDGFKFDYDLIYERKGSLKPYSIVVEKMKFKDFVKTLSDDAPVDISNKEGYIDAIKKGYDVWSMWDGEYHCVPRYLEHNGNFFVIDFSTGWNHSYAELIGTFATVVLKGEDVYKIRFTDPQVKRAQNKELCEKLNKYVYFKEFGPGAEMKSSYFWKDTKSIKTFYKDLVAKDKSLPEEVLGFQELWERIFDVVVNSL